MGLLDGDVPGYTPPPMDQGLKQSIHDQQDRALNTTQQDYTNKLNQGLPTQNAQAPNNVGGDMAMSQAIQNKANKSFEQSLSQIKAKNDFQGLMMKHQAVENAAQLSNQLTSIQRGIASQVASYQTQAEATRYAIINGLMSGAGSIAGAMAANMKAGKDRSDQITRENQAQSASIGGDRF